MGENCARSDKGWDLNKTRGAIGVRTVRAEIEYICGGGEQGRPCFPRTATSERKSRFKKKKTVDGDRQKIRLGAKGGRYDPNNRKEESNLPPWWGDGEDNPPSKPWW